MVSLVSVLEQRAGYDVQITELREGRMSGPPRSRGRRGVRLVWVLRDGVAVSARLANSHPPSSSKPSLDDVDN